MTWLLIGFAGWATASWVYSYRQWRKHGGTWSDFRRGPREGGK